MTKISNTREMNETISRLTLARRSEWTALKREYLVTCEKLTVPQLIKSALHATHGDAAQKTGLISTALGVTSGIIVKKLVAGNSFNPFSKLLGVILEVFVAHKVTKNAGEIKEMGNMILEKITGPRKISEMP